MQGISKMEVMFKDFVVELFKTKADMALKEYEMVLKRSKEITE